MAVMMAVMMVKLMVVMMAASWDERMVAWKVVKTATTMGNGKVVLMAEMRDLILVGLMVDLMVVMLVDY